MTDIKPITAQVTELYDPLIHKPPRGQTLLLINPGGVLIKGQWFDGCLAWGFMPKIPTSVKARLGLNLFSDHAKQN